jgi:lysine/ornithine N-monooxygenase
VIQARASGTGIQLDLRHQANAAVEQAEFDAVVLATGYRRDDHKRLLGGLAEYIADGYTVERDYRLRTVKNFLPKIYLQGCCEDSHGLSDTLLSLLADKPERSRMAASAKPALFVAV